MESMIPSEDKVFVHSIPVDPDQVRQSKSFTTMPVRINKHDDIAVKAAERASQAWADIFNGGKMPERTCSGATIGTASGYWYIEASPTQLDWMAYIDELSLLHDDIGEANGYEFAIDWNNAYSTAINLGQGEARNKSEATIKLENLLCNGLLESMDQHPDMASRILKAVQECWLSDIPSTEHLTDLTEYLAIRGPNAGWGCCVTWWDLSLGTNLDDQDWKLLSGFMDACAGAMLLTNDYFSWQKEKHQPPSRINNAVQLFMRRDGVTEEIGLEMVKKVILDSEHRMLQIREQIYHDHPDLSERLKRWIEMMLAQVGSSHYWHSTAPRYHDFSVLKRDSLPKHTPNNPKPIYRDSTKDNHRQESILSDVGRKIVNLAPTPRYIKVPGANTNLAPTGDFQLDDSLLLAPSKYINSLSSKNVRGQLVDAFNLWFSAPQHLIRVVKEIINSLHNASLILDDIQDESPLRRGKTATHLIFGPAQAINSATHMFVQTTAIINTLAPPDAMAIFLDELNNIFIGQSWDLGWRFSSHCPTEEEYMAMVDRKTGAMFVMLVRLLHTLSGKDLDSESVNLLSLVRLMGRWYQVRDDYMNLQEEYCQSKGFCEDLDEGKLSLPIIKCGQVDKGAQQIILGIFRAKDKLGMLSLTVQNKVQIVDLLYTTGALEQTRVFIQDAEREIERIIGEVEAATSCTNSMLRLLVRSLGNIPEPSLLVYRNE